MDRCPITTRRSCLDHDLQVEAWEGAGLAGLAGGLLAHTWVDSQVSGVRISSELYCSLSVGDGAGAKKHFFGLKNGRFN